MSRELARAGSQKALSILTAVAVVVFIATSLYWARVIFIPVALTIYFAFILTPPVLFLQRRGLPRVPAVILVLAAALIGFAAVGLVMGRQVVQLTRTLPDHADKIKAKAETLKEWLNANEGNRLAGLVNDVYDTFTEDPKKAVRPGDAPQALAPPTMVLATQPTWVARAQGFLGPAAEILGQAAFTGVLLVFMLSKREDLRNRFIRLLGQGRLTTTTKAVDDTSRRLSRFLFVQFVLNVSFGVIVTGGLLLIQVPYAPLWGFLGFLMRYVPYIGSWIAVVPPTLFAFAVSDGWGPPILVFILFIGLELVAGNVAEPLLYGHSLGLSAVAQLIAAAFWAFLWGPVGLILSGPLTVCLLMLGKYVPQWEFLSVLLGDQPVLSPRVAFYQRLAARDQDEAATIVEKEFAGRPAEQVFDDVLIPVLAAARSDTADGRLSDDDLQYITTAALEVAEEVAEFKPAEVPSDDAPVRILLIPAKDAVDHAAVNLFGRLLDPTSWEVEVAPAKVLTSELLELTEKMSPAIVVIAALPPGGLTHTRILCKRLRQRAPDVKVVVGRWAAPDDDAPGWAQLKGAGADEVTASLATTKTYLLGWRSVLVAGATATKGDSDRKSGKALVGTASASI